MKEILLVGAGGFIGAALRYMTSAWFAQFTRLDFHWGSLPLILLAVPCWVGLLVSDWKRILPCP